MTIPQLTFFCELEPVPLQTLMTDDVISNLSAMHARLSLGILDFSSERVEIVRRLNKAGIPVIAWLLLPKDQGYYFHLRNSPQALSFYEEFHNWTKINGLFWAGIGLDIEPDIQDFSEISKHRWSAILKMFRRVMERKKVKEARATYAALVDQIHLDGYYAESYQFPLISDERKAGSTLLQRITGLVDVTVDREVWMLYTSFVRPHGPGILGSYAPEAQAIGLGVTGGGVDSGLELPPNLTWKEFSNDLRLSWRWCLHLYIFSLEGCVEQGFLEPLKDFTWDEPMLIPETGMNWAFRIRRMLQVMLWVCAHFLAIIVGMTSAYLLAKGLHRYWNRLRRDSFG